MYTSGYILIWYIRWFICYIIEHIQLNKTPVKKKHKKKKQIYTIKQNKKGSS